MKDNSNSRGKKAFNARKLVRGDWSGCRDKKIRTEEKEKIATTKSTGEGNVIH